MGDRGERRGRGGEAARRQGQGIAAGQHDLPDFGMGADIGERRREGGLAEPRCALPDRLAAEAESAVDRAGRGELQQRAVGIAMDETRHRALQIVADRIGALGGIDDQFAAVGDELARDRVGGIGGVDQRGERRRHRDRVARADRGELGRAARVDEARRDQRGGGGEGPRRRSGEDGGRIQHEVFPSSGADRGVESANRRRRATSGRIIHSHEPKSSVPDLHRSGATPAGCAFAPAKASGVARAPLTTGALRYRSMAPARSPP